MVIIFLINIEIIKLKPTRIIQHEKEQFLLLSSIQGKILISFLE